MCLICLFVFATFGGRWFSFCKHPNELVKSTLIFWRVFLQPDVCQCFSWRQLSQLSSILLSYKKIFQVHSKFASKFDSLPRNKPSPSDANLSTGSLEVEVPGCSESANASGTCLDVSVKRFKGMPTRFTVLFKHKWPTSKKKIPQKQLSFTHKKLPHKHAEHDSKRMQLRKQVQR